MIEIRYLQAESGANKFGTCNCCGKSSSEDPLMISIKFSYYGHGTLICLCDDCKKKLIEALPPVNNSEIPNSSDTISRQAAIDALRYAQHRFTVADEAGGMGTVKWSEDVIYFAAAERVLNDLPSAQPEIVRCKDCKHRDPEDKKCDCGHDIEWQLPRDDHWYCADGERGEDG